MKAERKYLAHFIDSSFGGTVAYVRLGKGIEELNIELNPDIVTRKDITGEQSVTHNGYEASSEVEPYYYEYDDALSEKIYDIAMKRLTGDACKTTVVDVLLKPGATEDAAPTVVSAYREDAIVVPNSVGGDTSGVQIPFTIHRDGNRTAGTFDLKTKAFTPASAG